VPPWASSPSLRQSAKGSRAPSSKSARPLPSSCPGPGRLRAGLRLALDLGQGLATPRPRSGAGAVSGTVTARARARARHGHGTGAGAGRGLARRGRRRSAILLGAPGPARQPARSHRQRQGPPDHHRHSHGRLRGGHASGLAHRAANVVCRGSLVPTAGRPRARRGLVAPPASWDWAASSTVLGRSGFQRVRHRLRPDRRMRDDRGQSTRRHTATRPRSARSPTDGVPPRLDVCASCGCWSARQAIHRRDHLVHRPRAPAGLLASIGRHQGIQRRRDGRRPGRHRGRWSRRCAAITSLVCRRRRAAGR